MSVTYSHGSYRMLLNAVGVLLLSSSVVTRVVQSSTIRALDGFGNKVAWWVVLKLPSHVQSPAGRVSPTPCDCPVPDCTNVATSGWKALDARATGLCYLYADSTMPEFQYFRDVGYECLGQGGNDPLSHTLKQKENSTYWAFFNDQLNGIAATHLFKQPHSAHARQNVCGRGDFFSAHAKGAVAFQSDQSGGFYLQTSTPNYPDPSRNDSFVHLGCQVDNNVQFAQHLVAMSFKDTELKKLGQHLQLARLCSSNFFTNEPIHRLLRSDTLAHDGQKDDKSSASAFYHALLDPTLPMQEPLDPMKADFRLKVANEAKSDVFLPLAKGAHLVDFMPLKFNQEVRVLVKSPRAAVPPWALVAEMFESDISVASWWDGNYGIPTICAGDVYTHSPHKFCLHNPLTGVELNADGSSRYNIENLLQATWHRRDGSTNVTWQLIGGQVADGNHAKFGLTTPRFGPTNGTNAFVTFGDLNMEGFPCSKTCNGSQAGRGGTFFSFLQPQLHQSLIASVISSACHCVSPAQPQHRVPRPSYEQLRMCNHGCHKKVDERLAPTQLPLLSMHASSFWS